VLTCIAKWKTLNKIELFLVDRPVSFIFTAHYNKREKQHFKHERESAKQS